VEDDFDWGRGRSLSNEVHRKMDTNRNNDNLAVVNPQTYISIAREGMGMIERYKFDRSHKQDIAKYAKEVASILLEKQRKSIEHQMMLSLDIEKKHRLKAYQEEIYRIDQSIESTLKESEKQIAQYFIEHVITMKKGKKSYSDRFQSMVNSGELFQEDADDLNSIVNSVTNKVSQNAHHRLELLLASYGNSYERTISLLHSMVS